MFSNKKVDEEIKNLKAEIKVLRNEITNKATDDEKAAKQASKKCSEYKNRCETAESAIRQKLIDASENKAQLDSQYEEIKGLNSKTLEIAQSAQDTVASISTLNQKIDLIEQLFSEKDSLNSKIEELSSLYEEGKDASNKINAIHTGLIGRKSEIDSLYYEINGYDENDEENEGESIHVDGLKDKLEASYSDITSEIETLKNQLLEINDNAANDYESYILSVKDKYKSLFTKIRELLPDALTAGLSHAFSKKRESEILEMEKWSNTFSLSIIGLVIISLIPFAINIYLLIIDTPLSKVIEDIPRVVVSILPLYIPVLWLAYSSNKKINLSKRLIEEYTHKEVLSQTFEGLSGQIDDIDNSETSSELKIRLLYNILEVSSENPGKLISDYNKSDHPLMDALDKSAKLSNAIDKLSNIPGFSKISKILEEKSSRILNEQGDKISDALASVADNEKEKEDDKPQVS